MAEAGDSYEHVDMELDPPEPPPQTQPDVRARLPFTSTPMSTIGYGTQTPDDENSRFSYVS